MENEREKSLPVDRGWAWAVLGGAVSVYFFYAGVLKSFGILFVEFVDKYQESAAVTALVSGLESACFTIAALLSLTVGLNYANCRTIVICGGLFLGTGFILSSFAQDVYFLLVSYSVVFGLGHGMVTGPVLCLLGEYFETKRGIANGAAMSACSVGGLLFAPLCRALLDEYGLQGTLLIFGGLVFNCVVGGALMRPIEFFSLEKRRAKLKASKSLQKRERRKTQESGETNGNISKSLPTLDTEEPFRARSPTTDSTFSPLARRAMLKRMRSRTESEVAAQEPMLPQLPQSTTPQSKLVHEPPRMGVGRYFSNESLINVAVASSAGFKTSRESVRSRRSETFESTEVSAIQMKKQKTACQGVFNCKIFCNLAFVLFAPGYWLGSIAGSLPVLYLPAHAGEIGIHGQSAALLLSITGACDAMGRLLAGVVSDQFHINPRYLLILACVINGLMQQFSVLFTTYWHFVIYAVVYGIFSGFLYSLYAVIVLQMVGNEDFRSTITVLMIGQGIAFSISNPSIGALKDSYGSYDASLHYTGACALMASILFSMETLIYKLKSSKEKETDIELSPG
ncbi:monocarboxylate transporter 9-like [Ylistrum balloti]|uniref:monocarboxylate transporter 9-like n=1 Tax=Ylistrum balloti TaxID=509963 RepID=UPI002905F1CF|nr:monocarboxylate transporter 9-like [Ylistrum balloti]